MGPAGARDVNGWKNAGLSWSYKIPASVAYGSTAYWALNCRRLIPRPPPVGRGQAPLSQDARMCRRYPS